MSDPETRPGAEVGGPPQAEPQSDVEGTPAHDAPAEAEETQSRTQAVPIGALPTGEVLRWTLSLLAAKAWEGMGLVPNPVTNTTQKNLEEARLAIDAFAAVFEVLRMRIDEPARREMETLLTNLRLNFVEKSAG
ncbi:MAG TPA: DUF1844 domain-containing protein [bacterium]|nr:DUF1844 domain-containing protein [bacterium]